MNFCPNFRIRMSVSTNKSLCSLFRVLCYHQDKLESALRRLSNRHGIRAQEYFNPANHTFPFSSSVPLLLPSSCVYVIKANFHLYSWHFRKILSGHQKWYIATFNFPYSPGLQKRKSYKTQRSLFWWSEQKFREGIIPP